nr:hypothetical protein [Burkholderia pyrrocinia]
MEHGDAVVVVAVVAVFRHDDPEVDRVRRTSDFLPLIGARRASVADGLPFTVTSKRILPLPEFSGASRVPSRVVSL